MRSTETETELTSPLVPDSTLPGRAKRHYHSLDGLRGLAVLMVIVFHAGLALPKEEPMTRWFTTVASLGWVGVDVFFVLSGFLITGILLDSRAGQHYFKNFYARRLLRIVPAYYLVLGIVFLVLPWFLKFDTEGLQIIQHNQGWLWTHLTNWGYIWRRKAFTASDWLDLNHLWSLAVEEQFYLVWPAIVFFLNQRWLKVVCYLCVGGSVLLRGVLWGMHMRNGALYFPTPCRLDGLALGSLVAVYLRSAGPVQDKLKVARIAGAVSVAGLIALTIWRKGFVFTDSANVVFGVFFVGLLTSAAVSAMAEGSSAGFLQQIFNLSPLRTVGKYSYGLYLYHILLLTPMVLLFPPQRVIKAVGSELLGDVLYTLAFFIVAFAVALLSWHLYEKQWLKLKSRFDYQPGLAKHAI